METMGLQTSAVFPGVGEEFPQTMTGPTKTHTAARAQQLVMGSQPFNAPEMSGVGKSHILCKVGAYKAKKKRVVINSN